MQKQKVSIHWFRRDLRLDDNHALFHALKDEYPVLPVFIFDETIIKELPKNDPRITFIYDTLQDISLALNKLKSGLYCKKGVPTAVWNDLLNEFEIKAVYANEDYEPYAIKRDKNIAQLLSKKGIQFHLFKDQVIFAKDEVQKKDKTPYTVFTPYKNKWLERLNNQPISYYKSEDNTNYLQTQFYFPSIIELGFEKSKTRVIPYNIERLENYDETRNFPALNRTSNLSPYLRFGLVSIRKIVKGTWHSQMFVSELIWREFFMQILYHFPRVIYSNFRKKYDLVKWRNNPDEFEKWKNGLTGYPMVDAGIRQLNETGYMHNRVRMIVAGFLCKHLLIDWRWGEAYFAEKLLDYELSSNNGNWQWAAGTGCDAAPYFRVFNPTTQIKKFDKNLVYINKWIPEFNSLKYPTPMVEHKLARERALAAYKKGIELYI